MSTEFRDLIQHGLRKGQLLSCQREQSTLLGDSLRHRHALYHEYIYRHAQHLQVLAHHRQQVPC